MQQAPKGALKQFTADEIAEAAGWDGDADGFVKALIACGWLDADMRVHNWAKHAGKFLKQRDLNKERQQRFRKKVLPLRHRPHKRDVTVTSPLSKHDTPVTSPLRNALEERRGEESREEENSVCEVTLHGTVVEPRPGSSPSGSHTLASPLVLPPGFPKTREIAIAAAAATGVPPEVAGEEWEAAVGMGGLHKGEPIRSWAYYAKRCYNHRLSRLAQAAHQPNGEPTGKPRGAARTFAHEAGRPVRGKVLDFKPKPKQETSPKP